MALSMPAASVLMEMVAVRGRAVLSGWKQLGVLPTPDTVAGWHLADYITKALGFFQANVNICGAYIKSLRILEVRTMSSLSLFCMCYLCSISPIMG